MRKLRYEGTYSTGVGLTALLVTQANDVSASVFSLFGKGRFTSHCGIYALKTLRKTLLFATKVLRCFYPAKVVRIQIQSHLPSATSPCCTPG